MRHPYTTAGGRVSMDPAKWQVCQFVSEELHTTEGVVTVKGWGIYPPFAAVPHQVRLTHTDAVNEATRYAMFAVVPPENLVPDVLRDKPIEGEHEHDD